MASLETRPDGPADVSDRLTALEQQQRSDEQKFKAIAKQQRHNQIFQGVMILFAVAGMTGITITEEHQDKLIGLVITVAIGAAAAPLAEGKDAES